MNQVIHVINDEQLDNLQVGDIVRTIPLSYYPIKFSYLYHVVDTRISIFGKVETKLKVSEDKACTDRFTTDKQKTYYHQQLVARQNMVKNRWVSPTTKRGTKVEIIKDWVEIDEFWDGSDETWNNYILNDNKLSLDN